MTQEPFKNKPYLVRKAPFQRIVNEYLERMGEDPYFDVGSRGQHSSTFESIGSDDEVSPLSNRQQVGLLIWGEDNGYDPERSGESLRAFLDSGSKSRIGYWVEFDVADRVVTRLVGPMAWLCDPELNEIYESVNLKSLDLSRPTCEAAELELVSEIAALSVPEAMERFGLSSGPVVRARRRHRELTEAAAA